MEPSILDEKDPDILKAVRKSCGRTNSAAIPLFSRLIPLIGRQIPLFERRE
jgi:hypothetical protein